MTVSIELKNITLDYPVYDYRALSLRFALTSLVSAGTISAPEKGVAHVRAVEGISFNLQQGDRLALIGGNGAGKTSLLKTIAGIYEPSYGAVNIQGCVTTILGTGFGLDDEATGYHNIILGGIAMGYRLSQMEAAIENIANFTELGKFLGMPMRTYSAGMRARLAFAIATCHQPDILLIDEGIGAGDASFYNKAKARLDTFLEDASILVLASHAEDLLERFCNKCLLLNHGKQIFFGELGEGLARYAQLMDQNNKISIAENQSDSDVVLSAKTSSAVSAKSATQYLVK